MLVSLTSWSNKAVMGLWCLAYEQPVGRGDGVRFHGPAEGISK